MSNFGGGSGVWSGSMSKKVWGRGMGGYGGTSLGIFACLCLKRLFDKIQGGNGICQKVFFRHKNENNFSSNLGGGWSEQV